MYHVETIDVKEIHPDQVYFSDSCHKVNNMYNVANFYKRNLFTGLQKDENKRTPNEIEVIKTVNESIPHININLEEKYNLKIANIKADKKLSDEEKEAKIKKVKHLQFKLLTKENHYVGMKLLDAVFRYTENPDFRAIHSHLTQNAITQCDEAWAVYFENIATWFENPGKLTGKPKLPGYKKSGGETTAVFDNKTAIIKNGTLLFPRYKVTDEKGKKKTRRAAFSIANLPHAGKDKLIETRVVPKFGSYQIQIVTDDGIKEEDIIPKEEDLQNLKEGDEIPGVMALDPGLENFAAIADNKGNTPIVIKGGAIKSRNRYFNKIMAFLKSEQMKGHDTKTYHPEATKRMNAVSRKREAFLRDTFYKYAHYICRLMKERNLTYLIIGKNKGQKQNINLGHETNQSFCFVPYNKFNLIITTVAREYEVKVIFQEESYTSKACFAARDEIPTYGENQEKEIRFSGKRNKRGLYKQNDGRELNADINGSMNIGRKYNPNIYLKDMDIEYLYGEIKAVKYNDITNTKKKTA